MEMEVFVLFLVQLFFTKGLSALEIKPSKNPIPVGENVTLDLSPPTPTKIGAWLFNSTIIFIWFPDNPPNLFPEYDGSAALNVTTGSLFLKSVRVEDSGIYVMQGFDPSLLSTVMLSVQEPVTNVSLSANATDLVEFNDTVSLTCSASGTSLSFQWLNGSSDITASERVQMIDGNRTLIISSVLRSDKGPLYCVVSNGISNGTSNSFFLNIRYGPSNLTLTLNPNKPAYMTESNLTLSCSSQSNPPAYYQWEFEGRPLNQTGSELRLGNVHQNQSGNYTCCAYNNATLRYAGARIWITIIEPILDIIVNFTAHLPILNETFTLNCNVSGPVDSIQWLKDGWPLLTNNRTTLSADNGSLTFNPVKLTDDGNYYCEATNPVSNMTSPVFKLLVNYGPELPVITGPAVAETGSTVTFNCTASSQPPSQYSWYFNGTKIAEGSVYGSGPLTLSSHGEYTCVALNSVTGKNSSAVKNLTVIAPVMNVVINVSEVQPVVNSTFTMTCEVNGTVDYIQWLKDGWPLFTNNRTTLSADNGSLTFNPVQLTDDGNYYCEASNPVSNMTSPVFKLLVNYGPELPVITGPAVAETGSTVTFNCTASSQPPSQYSWYFNGTKIAEGSVYGSGPLTLSSHGEYTCVALNSVTGKNSSAVKNLTVIAPIMNVVINVSEVQPVVNSTFTMTCEVNGMVDYIQWLKDGWPLFTNNRTTLSADNGSLTFNPVKLTDDGNYYCEATNPVSNMTSPVFKLLVNYGPELPVITGPAVAETGSTVTFNCTASSQPPSQYSWYFNGTKIAEGSVYGSGPLTLSSHGEYTCVALNSVTGKNSSAVKNLTVIAPISSVMVKASPPDPIESFNLTLTCAVNGFANTIHWLKDGRPLNLSDIVKLSENNSSVTFSLVHRSDDGSYQCVASSFFSNKSSPEYQLLVNYGPETPVIKGPTDVKEGLMVTLACFAYSQPLSQYSWVFNNGTHFIGKEATLTISHVSLSDAGLYTCIARNVLLNSTASANISLNVTASSAAPHLCGDLIIRVLLSLPIPLLMHWLSR